MAQMLTGSVVRLIITVGTLAAIYFFIVKPILDTTNDAFEQGFNATESITESINDSFDSAGLGQIDRVKIPDEQKQAERMLDCVEKAGQNVVKLNACAAKFSP